MLLPKTAIEATFNLIFGHVHYVCFVVQAEAADNR